MTGPDSDIEVIELAGSDALDGAELISLGDDLPGPVTDVGDLADVELVPVHDEPSALVRDPQTGIFHNVPLSQVAAGGRGSTIFYVETPAGASAPAIPSGARVGDHVHVVAGPDAGTVYQVQEG